MLLPLQKIGARLVAEHVEHEALVWAPTDFKLAKNKEPTYVEIVMDLPAYRAAVARGTPGEEAAAAAVYVGRVDAFSRTDSLARDVSVAWLWDRGGVRMTGGPNTPSHYPGVRTKNLANLYKSLYGKPGKDGDAGSELLRFFGAALPPELVDLVTALRPLASGLMARLGGAKFGGIVEVVAEGRRAKLSEKADPVFVYLSVKEDAGDPVPLAQARGAAFAKTYEAFVADELERKQSAPRLDFLTGEASPTAAAPGFAGRYNLNKIFVTQTANYSAGLTGSYDDNYRLSAATEAELDAASEYLLSRQRVQIAGVSHAVLPTIVGKELDSLDDLADLRAVTDLAFGTRRIEEIDNVLRQQTRQRHPYWIDFIAYDSNGNFFKIVNWIHEVPRFHLVTVVRALRDSSLVYASQLPPDGYVSLYTLSRSVPILAEGKPGNEALRLVKAILERRPVSERTLLAYWHELILVHRYGRYRKYNNVDTPKGTKDQIADRGYSNAVTVFGVLRHALHALHQLTDSSMNEDRNYPELYENLPDDIAQHFARTHYTPRQQGVFFLGRALSGMAYTQFKKGNAKRIMQKVNFNGGMDHRSLQQLAIDLAESGLAYKAKESNLDTEYDRLSYNLARFDRIFGGKEVWTQNDDELGPALSATEALYFLLAGANWKDKRKPKPGEDDAGPTADDAAGANDGATDSAEA